MTSSGRLLFLVINSTSHSSTGCLENYCYWLAANCLTQKKSYHYRLVCFTFGLLRNAHQIIKGRQLLRWRKLIPFCFFGTSCSRSTRECLHPTQARGVQCVQTGAEPRLSRSLQSIVRNIQTNNPAPVKRSEHKEMMALRECSLILAPGTAHFDPLWPQIASQNAKCCYILLTATCSSMDQDRPQYDSQLSYLTMNSCRSERQQNVHFISK